MSFAVTTGTTMSYVEIRKWEEEEEEEPKGDINIILERSWKPKETIY